MSETKSIKVSSSSQLESQIGYSRVVRRENVFEVAGTIATDEDGQIVGPKNAYMQTKYIIEKVKAALSYAECDLSQIIRTRVYTTDINNWNEIGRAHKEYFSGTKPVTTLVEVRKLILPQAIVEIEFSGIE